MADPIAEVVARFASSFDTKDWAGLESVLTDYVALDYSDLRGQLETLPRASFVSQRREALDALVTEHQLSNFSVRREGAGASVRASGVIRRRSGERFFNSYVLYDFGLVERAGRWQIASIKQRVVRNEGDPSLHRGAAAKLGAASVTAQGALSLADWLCLASVAVLGLCAGAMLTELLVLVPHWQALPPQEFLAWFRANSARLTRFYGTLEVAALGAAIAAALPFLRARSAQRTATLVAAGLACAVLATFLVYFGKANASFETGSIALSDVPAELVRWARWQWLRVALGLGAFGAALLALRRPRAAG
jgi:hypothetical protein